MNISSSCGNIDLLNRDEILFHMISENNLKTGLQLYTTTSSW